MSSHRITRLGHLGDGIADGPIFAPLTLPGEEVEGDVVNSRIANPRIITPSADRVKPPCSHFKACGGCALQHGSDAFVENWKADVVRDALGAHGLDAPIRQIHTSPPRSRRRATLSGKRTKKGALVGFHARGSDVIIDIPNCTLLRPELMAMLPALQELTVIGASRKAEIAITTTASEDGADILVKGGKPLDGPLRVELAAFAVKHDLARLVWDDELVAMERPPSQRFDGIAVVPPPGAFLQATKEGEAALLNAVQQAVGPAKQVIDLFAGCGTFALPLAKSAELHAVESVPEMLTAMDTGWRKAQGLKKLTTEARDLFRRPILPIELRKYQAAVIDPPRAGAEAQIAEIAKGGPPRLAMVSCNPVTFAQDAKTLIQAGYVLNWIDVVDQFRWSPHVELAAQFTRDHMPG